MISIVMLHEHILYNNLFYFNLGIFQKMKEGAENVERKIQAKVESMKNQPEDKGTLINVLYPMKNDCQFLIFRFKC